MNSSSSNRNKRSLADKQRDDLELKLRALEVREKELTLKKLEREEALAISDAHEHSIYTLFDEISEETVKVALQKLGEFSRRNPGKPIKLLLNSPGGLVTDGFALYDYLRFLSMSGHLIEVVALGEVASMGGVLLQAGDRRVMGRQASLMIHEVSTSVWGKLKEVEEELKRAEELYNRYLNVLASRSKLSVQQIRRKAHKRDWWLSSEESLKHGFIDEVL